MVNALRSSNSVSNRRPAYGMVALVAGLLLVTGCGRVSATQAAVQTSTIGKGTTTTAGVNKLTGGGSAGLGTVSVTASGPGSLHGRVLDVNQRPIAGAVVALTQTGARATTDATGTYRFSALNEGNYQFNAMATGLLQTSPTGILVQGGQDNAAPDITMAPGTGPSGITNITYTYESSFGNVGSGTALLQNPQGVAIQGSNVVVLDQNHSLLVHTGILRAYGNDDGAFIGKFGDYTHWWGFGLMKDTVTSVAVDASSRAWVLDPDAKTLWAFKSDGSQANKVALDVEGATSLAIDPTNGAMYMAAGGVTKLDGEGGNPQKLESAGNVTAIAAGKGAVWGIADNKVEKIAADGSALTTFGAGGANVTDSFQQAKAIAVDPRNGNVIVADGGSHNVMVYDTAGVLVGKVGDGMLQNPVALATDMNGRVYVLDATQKKVLKFLQTAVH